MNFRIGRIGELTRNKAVRYCFSKFVSSGDGTFHTFVAFCEFNLCSVSFKKIATFNTHGFRHGQNGFIAFGRCEQGKTDTGVTAGRFDDDCSFLDDSFTLGVFNHCQCDSILDGS